MEAATEAAAMTIRIKCVNRHNFTLVEMAVAMSILIVVALIIGTAGAAFYNGYHRSAKISDRLKMDVSIDRVMDGGIRNLVPLKWKDDDDTSRYVFKGASDSLHFTTLHRTHGKDRGAFLFVRLQVEDGELIAEYSSNPRLPWKGAGEQKYTREVLAENVQFVRFLYADLNDDDEVEWEDEWVEDDHDNLPLAIQMTVKWKDGVTEQWLRRTAGSSSNSTFGSREESSDDES